MSRAQPFLQLPQNQYASPHEDEQSPFHKSVPSHVGSTSLPAAAANVVLAVLGAGQLTLPYALKELGWLFGLGTFALLTVLTIHSLHTLTVYSIHFKPKPDQCLDSYAEQVVRVFGQLGYLGRRAGMPDDVGVPLMLTCAAAVIWPLSSLRDVSMLKKVSPLGCCAAVFITCVVLLCAPWDGGGAIGIRSCSGPSSIHGRLPGSGQLQAWPQSFLGVAASVPLFSFALNASWAYVPVLCSLGGRTPARASYLIGGSMAVIALNYLLIGFYGYATFCAAVQPDILDSLGAWIPDESPQGALLAMAKAMLSVQLTLALPMPMRFFVTRKTLFGEVLGPLARWLVSAIFVGVAAGLAALPLPLNTVMGITSSICASMIIYVLPSLIDLRLQQPGYMRKLLSAVSLPVGLFVLLLGTAANLLGAAVGS